MSKNFKNLRHHFVSDKQFYILNPEKINIQKILKNKLLLLFILNNYLIVLFYIFK